MKERPILMRGPLVCATLEDRKWQTRRVIKPQPTEQLYQIGSTAEWAPPDPRDHDAPDFRRAVLCPYGGAGDRLWVREAHAYPMTIFSAPNYLRMRTGEPPVYRADHQGDLPLGYGGKWRPSIHMPRWASRLTLEITSVRVERIQDINLDDMRAEGVRPNTEVSLLWRETLRGNFIALWDAINAKRGYGWDVNPWVWAISYRRIPQPD